LLQRQMRQLGSPFKFLGSPSSASKDALNLAREASEGIWAVVDFVPGRSEANRRFAEAYKKEYNEEYDNLSIWTYDGMKILAAAIQKVGEDRAKVREAILATQGYEGVQGTFAFTPNGDGLSEVSIVEIEKGQPKLLKVVNLGAR
jgi:branched-chain amino acid transport system substrate-binding protein